MAEQELLVGRTVRHRETGEIGIICKVYSDIPNGVRLDRLVDGFVSWNLADLDVLNAAEPSQGGDER